MTKQVVWVDTVSPGKVGLTGIYEHNGVYQIENNVYPQAAHITGQLTCIESEADTSVTTNTMSVGEVVTDTIYVNNNPLSNNLMSHFQYTQPYGVGGGDTNGADQRIPINTVVWNDIPGCYIAAEDLFVPEGQYTINAIASLYDTGTLASSLTVDSVNVANGVNTDGGPNPQVMLTSLSATVNIIGAPVNVRIYINVQHPILTYGMGKPLGIGGYSEIYSDIVLQKIG